MTGVTPADYRNVLETLSRHCVARGLDILQPLQAGWYNESVTDKHRIADFGQAESLVVLIGNTHRFWPVFVSALRQNQNLLDQVNPVDAFVEQTITAGVNALEIDASVRWAHRPQPHHIAIQRMAEVSGLAWRSPALLSIHPVHGPWIGLRAAVVFPVAGPARRPAPAPVCHACDTGCLRALERWPDNPRWQDQLCVRDACPIGRQSRYSDEQIAYHYTKSKQLLREVVDNHQGDN